MSVSATGLVQTWPSVCMWTGTTASATAVTVLAGTTMTAGTVTYTGYLNWYNPHVAPQRPQRPQRPRTIQQPPAPTPPRSRPGLSVEEVRVLTDQGYLDLRLGRRVYRIPARSGGMVGVMRGDRVWYRLCLQPVTALGSLEWAALQKLLLQADERAYWRQANLQPVHDALMDHATPIQRRRAVVAESRLVQALGAQA